MFFAAAGEAVFIDKEFYAEYNEINDRSATAVVCGGILTEVCLV